MSPTRILFVDDEAHILEGLQNLLRKQRHVWDMVFSVGGEEALAALEAAPFDVIVSDMRMPGMDGAALLQIVKDKYPRVARIVLSGHADRDAVVRTLPVAHQFLSKPCDADLLQVVIERTCNLQALLHDEAIRNVIGTLETLPSLPRVYLEITQAMTRPNVGLIDIANIVEQDPAMSAKVLQLVNSAFFGLSQRMTSIRQAVVYLGLELLKALALTAHVFATREARSIKGFSLDRLQQSSLLTARLARRLVGDQARREEAFAAGMLHDIGTIILALGVPDRFANVIHAAQQSHRPFHEVEREMLGVTHAEVGAYLLGVWGLPHAIVEAVAYHHAPGLVPAGTIDLLAAVHVADALIDRECAEDGAPPANDALDIPFLEALGCAAELPRWRAMAKEEVQAVADAA